MTDLAAHRRGDDVIRSFTFFFNGINYGTFPISTPYTRGKPIVLYLVPAVTDRGADIQGGPLDCLVTDDVTLTADMDVAW